MKNKRITEMNLVPYIDVMLVLLIIFMVTAPMLVNGINVELPELTKSSVLTSENGAILSIDVKGNYYLDTAPNPNRPVSLEKVVEYCQKHPKEVLLLKADRRLKYELVIKALDVLQQQGLQNIGLVTN